MRWRWIGGVAAAVVVVAASVMFVGVGEDPPSEPQSFSFWPREGASAVPGFEGMEGHPCGEVAYAKVSKLPIAKDDPLESEVVVELDAGGKVIHRWPMPVDYWPIAIRGEELLVSVRDRSFWVREDGTFRREPELPEVREPKSVACDLTSVFGESAYSMCHVFVDLRSLKERTLGYQAVCT